MGEARPARVTVMWRLPARAHSLRALSTKAKAKKNKGGGDGMLDQGTLSFIRKVISPPANTTTLDPELVKQAAVAAKEYSRSLMRRHHSQMGAMQKSLELQQAAIEAIPDQLKPAALEDDTNLFPMTRLMPTWTPPIPGFADKKNK